MAKRPPRPKIKTPPQKKPPAPRKKPGPAFAVHPLTEARWDDLEALFGVRGACGGCWCMYWRLPRSRWNAGKGEGNRRALLALVRGGRVPGLIAYVDGEPAAWCTVGPRSEYGGLDRSRVLKRFDEEEAWSIPCFFVARAHRKKGLTVKLIEAAVAHARKQGATMVEGYPVDPPAGGYVDTFAYTGLVSAFRQAGFAEVLRRSPTRPIMRISTDGAGKGRKRRA